MSSSSSRTGSTPSTPTATSLQYEMAKAILSFQEAAKTAMADGALLNDVVNVPARSNLMRGRFEEGYIDHIEAMVKEMNEQIANAEAN